MKKKKVSSFRVFLVLNLFISFLSCVNNLDFDEEDSKGSYSIALSTRILHHETRVAGDDFEIGDEIGLFVMNQPALIDQERHVDNIKYTYSSAYEFSPEKTIFFADEDVLSDFISYYPYKKNAVKQGESTIEVEIYTNQDEQNYFSNSDFLVAVSTGIYPSLEAVNLVFKHKLSKICIQINPGNGYTAEELLEYNPEIRIKDVYTKAIYDFADDSFESFNTISDVSLNGEWEIENGLLVGKNVILLPQSLQTGHALVEVTINGREFLGGLSNEHSFEKGAAVDLEMTLTPKADAAKCVLNTRIDGWKPADKQKISMNETASHIKLSSIDFAQSNVYTVINKGKQVAEICKEYLVYEGVKAQAIVVYPIFDDKVDLSNGLVAQVLEESDKKHGGHLAWNTSTNGVTYIEGSSSVINVFYITEDGSIVTTRPENPLQLLAKPHRLVDTRGFETITYPIVKIGTQYWMRGNLKTTKYTDGKPIEFTDDFSASEARYCQNGNYFYYNSQTIATGMLVPEGWKIGSNSDWEQLKQYIGNDASVLKNGASWKNSKSEYPYTNLSGFNAVATGMYGPKLRLANQSVYFWATTNTDNTKTERSVILSLDSNKLTNGTNAQNTGLAVRCLMN